MHRRYGLTRLLALAAMALAPAWGSAALLTIGPDAGFVPRVLTQLPTSAPVSGTALSTLGDGSVGFNGGLATDGSGLFAIGNDSFGASTLYSMTAGGGSLTPIGSGLGFGFYGGLAYRSGGDLFAIASDSSAASTLYKVTGGSATAVGSGLGSGFYGGLTYNADDGLLYAIAGDAFGVQRVLVSIDAGTGMATGFSVSLSLGDDPIDFNGGLAYDASADRFFVIGNDRGANSSLYSFTLAGDVANIVAIGSSFGQGFRNASLVLLPDGGTPVSEPSTLMLLSGLLWLGRVRRRGPRR